jgi:SAM-dependent methyltransferase
VQEDARRWDERYGGITVVEPRAPEAIERWPHLESLVTTSGRCVDVACGPGSVALWLAGRGADVVALDVSGVAIDLLRRAASRTSSVVDARVVDLDDGLPDDLVDLDLVVCQRFRDPSLYGQLVARLRPGGVALVTVLSAVGAAEPGPFHAPAGELRAAFSVDGCELLYDAEGDGVAHAVVRRS